MIKYFLFTFIGIFFSQKSYSQYNLKQEQEALIDSIRTYLYNTPDKALPFIDELLKSNIRAKDRELELQAYATKAIAFDVKNNIDSTLFYFNKGLKLCKRPEDRSNFKFEIANIYEKNHNYDYALLMYKQCYEIAKNKNFPKQLYHIEQSLAILESKMGNSQKALKMLNALYKKEKDKKEFNKQLREIRKNLIEVNLKIKRPDTALKIINEGLLDVKARNNVEYQFYYYKLQAESYLEKNEPTQALTSVNNTLKKAKLIGNLNFINESEYTLALVNKALNKPETSIQIIEAILARVKNSNANNLSKYYKLIAESSKAADKNELSAHYYELYTNAQENINNNKTATLKHIYDFDLKEEIQKRKEQEQGKEIWVIVSIVLGVLGVFFLIKNVIRKKQNKLKFETLMQKVKAYEDAQKIITNQNIDIVEIDTTKKGVDIKEEAFADTESTTYVLNDEKVSEILKKIKQLEEKKYYLRQDCTLYNMSKRLKTNTSYLSKIFNTHLNKTFSIYINELRINYIILELKQNKTLRAYSTKAISEEIGYKSSDSFTKYFKQTTGISPSVYIKSINKLS